MNKTEILKKYSNEEDKIIVAKLIDKINYTKSKKQISIIEFLTPYQKKLVEDLLINLKEYNYIFYGGYEQSERNLLIIYPDFLDGVDNKKEFVKIINIKLPNELINKYNHRDYLGMIMKLGIKREKIGDIIVHEDGADIIVINEIADFLWLELRKFTRLKKSEIQIKNIDSLRLKEITVQEITVILPSLRLDALIAKLINSSRTKANELVLSGRVYINWEQILNNSKSINTNDILTIRGKGRYKILEILGNTKKGKIILKVEKYI